MKFHGTLKTPRIGLQAYQQKLHEHLSEEIAHAAFLWLSAVLEQIPVWSGASHATFLNLSRAIGQQLAIDRRAVNRIPYGQRHGKGEVKADPTKHSYTFVFETTLPHLIYNEFNNANITPDPTLFYRLLQPGPYHFQQIGAMTFLRYAATVRLPNPWNSLSVKSLKVT